MLFLELIQVAFGNRDSLSHTPTDKEWADIFELSQKQAVVGVAFEALTILSKQGLMPPLSIFYEWLGLTEQIKGQNFLFYQRCLDISQLFEKAGFKSCILKGQGNALMYPNPLCRMPGDIDIWVEGDQNDIRKFVKKSFPDAEECTYHINYPIFEDVPVEVHYKPSYTRSTRYGKRLSSYYKEHASVQFANKVHIDGIKGVVSVPTYDFNIIFQMAHILNHFVNYGVGLRQIIDYYYLVIRSEANNQKDEWNHLFKQLGLLNIAGAIMWVLNVVLGLQLNYLVTEPDERRGRLLLNEILACGNMGKYDQRLSGRLQRIHPYTSKFLRSVKTGMYFPYEVWISPIEDRLLKHA